MGSLHHPSLLGVNNPLGFSMDCRLSNVSGSQNPEDKLFPLLLTVFLARCDFHSSSDNEKSPEKRGGDRGNKMSKCSAASLTSFFAWIAAIREIAAMILSSFTRAFLVAESIGLLVATWMTAVSKASQTSSSVKMEVSFKRVAFLSNPRMDAMLWPFSKFFIISIKKSSVTCLTRESSLSVSLSNASSIMSQTFDWLSKPSTAGFDAASPIVGLYELVCILFGVAINNRENCSPLFIVFCLRLFELSSFILDGGGAVSLRVRPSGMLTEATSCGVYLHVLMGITKFQLYQTFCNIHEYSVQDSSSKSQSVTRQLLLSGISKLIFESKRIARGYSRSVTCGC